MLKKEGVLSKEIGVKTVFPILFAISLSHLLNDTMQSLIPSVYPILKNSLNLSFAQVGLITFTFQMVASILQPLVGLYTDRNPKPYSLAIGMGFTLCGLILLSQAASFPVVLVSVALVGMGSSVFHPEASRIAFMASGNRRGLAQSIFQVGGNAGSSIGPLLAALIVVPYGQFKIIWFSLAAIAGISILYRVGIWYKDNLDLRNIKKKIGNEAIKELAFSRKTVVLSLLVLLMLMFSKYFYMASMTSYYIFYLMDRFDLPIQTAQVYLFIFLFSIAAGTFLGGPIGDKYGRKFVIWFSILGVTPFTLMLPHVDLFWTAILTVFIGVILASAFSAILIYAQELIPGKVGLIAGLFFGLAFGLGGIGSAVLGWLADQTSIRFVYQVCAFLPLIGLLAVFLPNIRSIKK